MAKRTTTFSMRMPDDLNERIQAYAVENNCTKAEAMSHYARAGIELEDNGMVPAETSNTDAAQASADAEALARIERRLEALQNLPTIEPDANTAIIPLDIRDKIQSYSRAHDCSEQEALLYYARIGVQMSGENRLASANDLEELGRRVDILAQDVQTRTEQMRQMADAILNISEYIKPGEVVIDAEASVVSETVPQMTEVSEEERQREEDERTRRVVNEAMGEYFSKQRPGDTSITRAQRRQHKSPVIPFLIIIIIGLLISLAALIYQH